LIQPEFTAQMETALDAIATGEQEWQTYLIGWNQSYFGPAIAKAKSQLLSLPTFAEKPPTPSEKQAVQPTPSNAKPTKTRCPTCGETMNKVPSRSKKLKTKHFLKCSGSGCGTVMFWNAKAKRYELPRQATQPAQFTDHPCPVCGALLERYAYNKDGQDKVMLRCSLLDNRRGKCKEVAFFQSRGEFWSPKFGTLTIAEPDATAAPVGKPTSRKRRLD
ncbi:DNA topoisomerase I, partial [filamentous cyanobacterium CCP4]